MTALGSITAVRPTANTTLQIVPYGATISAGQPVYRDATDGEYKLTDADASSATADAKGVAMTPGVDGGYGVIATKGDIVLVGTTMAVGETYYAGPTAGEIIPDGDLTTGDRVTRIGTASSATVLKLSIQSTGITHA